MQNSKVIRDTKGDKSMSVHVRVDNCGSIWLDQDCDMVLLRDMEQFGRVFSAIKKMTEDIAKKGKNDR